MKTSNVAGVVGRDISSDYFSQDGTVATWWDPVSEEDPTFRSWFLNQLDDVMAMVEPAGN